MRKLILAAVLVAVALPAFACEWTTKSVSLPQTPATVVQTEAPQTPVPQQPNG